MLTISDVGGFVARYVFERLIVVRYLLSLYALFISANVTAAEGTPDPELTETGLTTTGALFVDDHDELIAVAGTRALPT